MPKCINIHFALLLVLSMAALFSPASHSRTESAATIHFILPVAPEKNFNDIQSSSQWRESHDGWIAEHYSTFDFWIGETPKVTWVKLDLSELPESGFGPYAIELASSGVSEAELVVFDGNKWITLNSSDLLKSLFEGQPTSAILKSRFITFLVDEQWRENSIFLRVEATTKLHLQVNIKPASQLASDNQLIDAFFFFCYGILFVMGIYNLIIGYYLKDKIYFIYSLAIIATLLYQLFAHGHGRLFDYFDWDSVNHALNFLAMLSAFSAMVFLYFFAGFNQYKSKVASCFEYSLYALGIATFLTLIIPSNVALNITLLLAGPAPIFALGVALYAWHRGSKAAGIFVIAWSFYILGGSLWAMYWLGMLTINHYVELPLVAGAALESILLSLALGYRIQLMKTEGSLLKQSEEYYKTISNLDPLTQLANRRAFERHINKLQDKETNFGLILLDIDHFKNFNDTYGHPAGDKVIQALGNILKSEVRENDIASRIGGEEFAIVIESADIFVTKAIAERIREKFSNVPFSQNNETIYCTVSMGISVVDSSESIESMLERTDKALYKAKEMGRNQCQLAA